MKVWKSLFSLFLALTLAGGAQELITVAGESPLIDIQVQFAVGAIDDPKDRQGLAYLTAHSLSAGSTQKRSYQELLEVFYPWAVSLDATVGKEVVTFSTTVHKDHLEQFTPILLEMLSQPKFAQGDLDRLRDKGKNYLTQDLRVNNDEELGKEALYLQLYPKSHPYGHHNAGSVSGLEAVTTSDLQDFYQRSMIPKRLTLGVAGGYPKGYPEKLLSQLSEALPTGGASAIDVTHRKPPRRYEVPKVTHPPSPSGRRVTIVEKDTRSVAMSLGFPIEVNRSHPDWAALFLFRSFLGEHRSSNSYLYERLREARGLNYGDYAYIEYFPNGMYLTKPNPSYPRSEQIFQIWIRPVQPETALFALRATFYEFEKLLRGGLSQEQFEATRSFLKKNAPLLVASSSRNLGYSLDSHFYGAAPFVERLQRDLDALTLEQLNETIGRHLQADNMEIVLIAKDAAQLKADLLAGKASPMTYNSEKPDSITQEDRVIENYPLKLDEVTIIPASSLFR